MAPAPKIFITGVTGYVGGDAFYALNQAHPEWEYTALVRNSDKAAPVAAVYPKVRFVYGNLDDAELLEEEASKADVVIHTADSSDHSPAAKAIAKGIKKGHTKAKPGFWIHLSGAGILTWKDMDTETFGEAPSMKPYDDLDAVAELTSLPDSAFHRDVDKIVLAAGAEDPEAVKTAIVCPPTIYGPGRGSGNKRSRQVYGLVSIALERGKTPKLGKGLTEWDNVHIHDLSDLFVLIAHAAVTFGSDFSDNIELWGERGYFLAENGHHVWGRVSQEVAIAAHEAGYISTDVVESMSAKDAKDAGGMEALTWGLNSKGYAKRARKYLGWNPVGAGLSEVIPDIVHLEARRRGLEPGHAKKAAGEA